MTQHNNWKDEFDRQFGVFLDAIKITVHNSRDREGANNLTKMYKKLPAEIKDFIDTLLIERTKACATIAINDSISDNDLLLSQVGEWGAGYNKACGSIATQITKLIETEE